MKSSKGLNVLFVFFVAALSLTACMKNQVKRESEPNQKKADTPQKNELDFGFIAFGDSGYHVDYLKKKKYKSVLKDLASFTVYEKKDWVGDGRLMSEFVLPPSEFVPAVGGMIESSGMYPVAKAMISYCETASCEFSVMLGDNIYPNGATVGLDGKDDTVRFDDLFSKPFGGMGADKPDYRIYTALGNHDWATSREGAMAQVAFMENTRPFFMDGLFYSVKPPAAKGEVEIFVIDTEVMLAAVTVLEAELNADGSEKKTSEIDVPLEHTKPQNAAERNMVSWLDEQLRNSTARWKFVIGHHPIWSVGGSKFEQARSLRALILPSLCQYADIYFAGHEHTLELHQDSCDSVFGNNHNRSPLLQVLSGAAAKQRSVHKSFAEYQQENYPDNKLIWAKGMIWGFSHIQLVEDNAEITLHTTPLSGSGETELEYTLNYKRRSSL
ncbi:MAG: metallophosphoesterase [Kangiellaceae bacterium]|nr:metallophosphoesterase [Kangiellaceae bacterium]